jgi:hypothetical protein
VKPDEAANACSRSTGTRAPVAAPGLVTIAMPDASVRTAKVPVIIDGTGGTT